MPTTKKKAAPKATSKSARPTKKAAKSAKSKSPAKAAKPAASKAKRATKKKVKASEEEVKLDRRRAKERREEAAAEAKPAEKPAAAPKLERREKVNRRRQIDPTTCERDYNDAEVEFMNALDAYKRTSGRMFPTCSEVLEVIRDLGYVQLSPAETAALRDQRGETETPADASIEDAAEAEAEEALADSELLRSE
ncbi:hypothetical protein MalM25_29400 [Planctomycetes bacterium MalM25]|nr:hypothetical protein MalM25_29400 [Planctomycetes bacterium MalM25]